MKRIVLLSFVSLALVSALAAHSLLAAFHWQNTSVDFGKIPQSKPVKAEFRFTNKGDAPLIITSARGSCGCTGVEYPQEAILPGQTGLINATFNAASVGSFSKTVTVESNAGGPTVLTMTGEVVPVNP